MGTKNSISAENGVVHLVDDLLGRAIRGRGSDVHFEPGEGEMRVRCRIDGLLHELDRIPGQLAENVIARLKVLAGLLTYRIDIPQEGAFNSRQIEGTNGEPLDLRVATFPTVRGERAVVRLLHTVGQISSLEELGLDYSLVTEFQRAARQPQGLILTTGPAGSGKSTTLYAIARYILSEDPGRSVVSLEDPVEQRITGMTQIQIAPHGELNYPRAMRSLLRQDVQVLLVGEIRDAETAHVVAEASLTGHLIMSTMHSGDPAETLVRLLEMGIAPYQLVSALNVVCAQRLVRVVCPACKGRGGCEECAGTGYSGRTACGQLAVMDETLRQAILDHRPVGELRKIVNRQRPDLATDGKRLVNAGKTTLDELRRVLGDVE